MNKVFICYSHKDKKYLDLLLKHFDNSLLDIWSDKRIEGAEHWEEEIKKALESCNCGILILSANFFNSTFIKDVEVEKLLQNKYEKNTYLVPILAEHCNIDKYRWISQKEVLPKGFKPIENIKKRNHNKEILKIVKRVEELLEKQPEQKKEEAKSNIVINYPDNIAENNFPTSNDDFFGREKYFDVLDKAWDDEQVNILSFIAFGGIGKTSLIDNWLKRMKKNHYRGAKNIFMWSFYSQGSEEDRQISAIEFLNEACKFFRVKNFLKKDSYEQGRELADIISNQRTLLILDGLEPLQSSLEDIGEVKDNGLQVLLKRLSRQNKGLVIITSRIKLAFIDNQYEELEKLEDSEGAELLDSFELNETKKELEQISNNFDGHALALKLLGSYTKVVLDGDINRIDEIESLMDDKSKSSKHATRMLNSYKKYLQRERKIELDILKLLGFFDRAISFEVIDVLKNKPLIGNINDSLIEVSEIDWKYALENLKKLHLISASEKILDTHPLVREYFSKYIFDDYKDSYIKGHYSLYKYYKNLPNKDFPDTMEEMEPLFQSIFHGCKANKYDESFAIYANIIEKDNILIYSVGRFDLGLKILSNFYTTRYAKIHSKFSNANHNVLNEHVAYFLSSLGKNKDALNIFYKISNEASLNNNYDDLISNLNNIMNICIFMGKFKEAESYFNKYNSCMTLTIHDTTFTKLSIKLQYASIKFFKGNFEEAEKCFTEVKENYPIEPTNGYILCEYLFYFKKINEVEKLCKSFFRLLQNSNLTSSMGHSYLILGKLKLNKKENKKTVLQIYDKAIYYFRKLNEVNFLGRSLVLRANALMYYKEFYKSDEDLQEAYALIIRSEAKLLLADWYIVAIQLALDEENFIKANTYFKEAKELSKELDEYFIFKEELIKLDSKFNNVK